MTEEARLYGSIRAYGVMPCGACGALVPVSGCRHWREREPTVGRSRPAHASTGNSRLVINEETALSRQHLGKLKASTSSRYLLELAGKNPNGEIYCTNSQQGSLYAAAKRLLASGLFVRSETQEAVFRITGRGRLALKILNESEKPT